MTQPNVAVIHFGRDSSQLRMWHNFYKKVNPSAQLCVLSDSDTHVPAFLKGQIDSGQVKWFVPTIDPELIRKDVRMATMDRKEAIALASLYVLDHSAGTLIVDSDAVFMRDPFDLIKEFNYSSRSFFGMCPDPLVRRVFETVERNAGVLYITPSCIPKHITQVFRDCWISCKEQAPNSILLGQKSWSLLHARMGGFNMDRRLNWSRMYDNPQCGYIVHYHGSIGKKLMKLRHDSLFN